MVELNWTYASLILIIATIPELFALAMSIYGYITTKYPHFLYMSLTWLFLSVSSIVLTIAYVKLDFILDRVAILLNIPVTFSLMLLMDSISIEKRDPGKLTLITIISTGMVIFAFDVNAVIENETGLHEITPALDGWFNTASAALFLISGAMWIYYMAKIHYHAPKNLKKDSRINLIGAIIAGSGSTFAFVTNLVWFLPGTDYLFIAIGALICSYAFIKQPKLGYVLPFKVNRVICINSKGGIPVFTYSWDSSGLIDSTLFSGALQGISAILTESISRGAVKEIILDNGVLIISRAPESSLIFALITSKSSPILVHGLQLFVTEFTRAFESNLANGNDLTDSPKAENVVKKCFPFLPDAQ